MGDDILLYLDSVMDILRRNGFEDAENPDDPFEYHLLLKKGTTEIYVRGGGFGAIFHYEVVHELELSDNTTTMGSVYSDNLNMYWLIGYLTHNGLMDKNYEH